MTRYYVPCAPAVHHGPMLPATLSQSIARRAARAARLADAHKAPVAPVAPVRDAALTDALRAIPATVHKARRDALVSAAAYAPTPRTTGAPREFALALRNAARDELARRAAVRAGGSFRRLPERRPDRRQWIGRAGREVFRQSGRPAPLRGYSVA